MASSDSSYPRILRFSADTLYPDYAVGYAATEEVSFVPLSSCTIPSSIPRVPLLASPGSFIHQNPRPSSPF